MLIELAIKNFAIIDSLRLSFGSGLNVFTGETGAGKSIIIDAIDLILGDRASADLIRSSAEAAQVEALFDISGDGYLPVKKKLKAAGIESTDELVIKRVVFRTGRNRVYINNEIATLATVVGVTSPLIDVCGQSEHQSLTKGEEHVELLDRFGGNAELRKKVAGFYRKWKGLSVRLKELRERSERGSENRELLLHSLGEIEAASLVDGEDTELAKEKERLGSAERLAADSSEAEKMLYSNEGSVLEVLARVARLVGGAAIIDDSLSESAKRLDSAAAEIEDIGITLRDYASGVVHDPARLEEIDDRIAMIRGLKKKYGATVEDILRKGAQMREDLDGIEGCEGDIDALEGELEDARDEYYKSATTLSNARKDNAIDFILSVEKELSTLGMEGARFEVSFETDEDGEPLRVFTEKGFDQLSLRISTNPGEGLKPLGGVASGGELSRIMLAIKNTTSSDRVPTQVFDEIDTGVGGTMAHKVGKKLKNVAGTCQVFCITHLPQIAVLADSHFLVSKDQNSEGRTVSGVTSLDEKQRLEEITRMLGGAGVATLELARELFAAADEIYEDGN